MILGVLSELSGVGGIQHVNRCAGAVLVDLAVSCGEPCLLLGLNDYAGAGRYHVDHQEYSFQGFGRSKRKLIARMANLAAHVRIAYFGHPNLSPLGLLLRLRNRRCSFWVATHGVEVWQRLPFLRAVGLCEASGVLAVSRHTAEHVVRVQGVSSSKVHTVYPPIDPALLTDGETAQMSLPVPPLRPVILSVCRLVSSEPGKGVDVVIRALPAILRSVPECCYVIAGDGDDRPRLSRLAQAEGVHDSVVFLGEVDSQTLKALYHRTDVFALPSRQEGLGLVFLEAMACGKPVVGGRHGGTPEVVRDGFNGYVVEHGDVEGLANRIIRLLKDRTLAISLGERGRRWVAENHSFGAFARRLTQVLSPETSNAMAETA